MHIGRAVQILFVAYIGLYAAVTAYSNFLEQQPNLVVIRHVLGMDTVFPDSALGGRAVTTPGAALLAYLAIIAAEAAVAALCLAGAVRLVLKRDDGAEDFHRAKSLAFLGLGLGFSLWYFGFMVIAGEWFAMWQSAHWNMQDAALKPVIAIGIVTIVLFQKE